MNYLRPEKYDLMASWLNFHGKNYTATESEQSVFFFCPQNLANQRAN